ncbi:MAG: hypothetical protein HY847_01520 [Betaproteobacteria bacterium]|nr:hypothetical protein [Betaproteobacteria bacterium]
MKRFQRGEAMVIMMVVMVAVFQLWSGHMGMFGHGSHDHDKPMSVSGQESGQQQQNR